MSDQPGVFSEKAMFPHTGYTCATNHKPTKTNSSTMKNGRSLIIKNNNK